MSFINPITDFTLALVTLNQQEPKVAQAFSQQVGNQSAFENYWRDTIHHIQEEIEKDASLDLTTFQKDFLLTLLTNCADNACSQNPICTYRF